METVVSHELCQLLYLFLYNYRLTFWLSNSIALRTIISRTVKDPSNPVKSGRRKKTEEEGYGNLTASLRVKGLYPRKNENAALGYGGFGNWDDPQVLILALEKVEAWIFSRIVESIWWQVMNALILSST